MYMHIKSKKDDVKQVLNLIRENIDLVIVDEAHRTMASEWNKAISYFCENQGTQMIGLTATPGRSSDEDTRLLGYFFDSTKICLVDDKYRVLTSHKFLSKKRIFAEVERKEVLTNYDLKISRSEYQNIKKFGNSNKLKEILIDLSRSPARNKIIIREIQKQYELDKKLLVFACSIEHCIILQSILAMRKLTLK